MAGGTSTGLVLSHHPGTGVISPKIVYRTPSSAPANVYNVPASYMGTPIYADCSAGDATVLNSWLASLPDGASAAAPTIINFAASGCYQVNGALQLVNRNNLTISGNGATFNTTNTEGQSGTKYWMPWYINGGTNISLSNMTLVGTSTAPASCVGDGCGTSTICQPSGAFEFQVGLEYAGTDGGNVTDVNISQSCGDFIDFYPYCTGAFTISGGCGGSNLWTQPAENITVTGGTDSVAGRQGMSVVDGEDITVQNTSQSWVGQDGIDVEPDSTLGYTNNLTFTGNTFTGIGNSAFNESGGGDLGSGNVAFNNNTWTASVACAPLANVNASGVSPVPSGFTFSGNAGSVYGLQYTITDVNSVSITGNTNTYTGGVNCFDYAVTAATVNTITVTGNVFAVWPAVGGLPNKPHSIFQSLSTVTGTITNCGNQTVNGPQQPKGC